jgi:hypothetical protein
MNLFTNMGSEDPRQYRYVLIRTFTTDAAGHCALQIRINTNLAEPNDGTCVVSIQAEAAAINGLAAYLRSSVA